MGDLIQSTPLMQGLQAAGYEVTLLYSDSFREIAGLLKGVDRLVPFSLSQVVDPLCSDAKRLMSAYRYLSKTLGELRKQSFDLVINVTHSAYSALLTGLIEGRRVIGLVGDGRGRLYNDNKWARYYLISQSCRESNRFNLVDVHRMMGGVSGQFPVGLNVPAISRLKANEILTSSIKSGSRIIGIVPGASTPEKTLPAEIFAESIKLIHKEIPVIPVIFGAKGEAESAGIISYLLPDAINLCGKTDVSTLAALIEKCEVLLTNDTGPMHIAASVGTKVVDISLGSALASETAPYGTGNYVIESRIGCHPCLPRNHCSHFSCGKSIPAEVIAQTAIAVISGQNPDWQNYPGFEQVKIYRTEFDADGFLQLEPLIEREVEAGEVIYDAMKQVWQETLGVSTKAEAPNRIVTGNTSVELNIKCEGFLSLLQIASIGRKSCEELARQAEHPLHTGLLRQLADSIGELDRQIARAAYARPEIMPLAMQFTSSKDNIHSTDLAGHARQTAAMFRELENQCETIIRLISSITVRKEGIVDAA